MQRAAVGRRAIARGGGSRWEAPRPQDAERDNRLIYMENPAQVDLGSISPAMMAKDAPLPVSAISDPDADMFARLEEVRLHPPRPSGRTVSQLKRRRR